MVGAPPSNRLVRAAAFAVLALGAGALACETSPPGPDAAGQATSAERPKFIPYDVAPELQNPGEVQARLQELYPDSLHREGIGGRVVLWMYVDSDGDVRKSRVQESSGHDAFDRAARGVVQAMEFSPALNRDQPRAVCVQQSIRFRAEEEATEDRPRTE